MRPAIARLAEVREESLRGEGPGLLLLQAPTGYGKTSATPKLYKGCRREGAPRLVHALPLRAVVAQAYEKFLMELQGEAVVGYQAHGLGLGGKSPFMSPDLVVTTMDSYMLSLGRVSVGERGFGHYEVPRSSLLTAVTVFDEAHLPYQSGDPAMATAMYMAVAALTNFGNTCIIETATLGREALEVLTSTSSHGCVVVEPTPRGERGAGIPTACRYEPVEDPDFFEGASSLEWSFEQGPAELGEVTEFVAEVVGQGLRVFVAVDRVVDAIELYRSCLLYTSPSPRDLSTSRMPSSA